MTAPGALTAPWLGGSHSLVIVSTIPIFVEGVRGGDTTARACAHSGIGIGREDENRLISNSLRVFDTRDCCSVAQAVAEPRLLLQPLIESKEKRRAEGITPARLPPVREKQH